MKTSEAARWVRNKDMCPACRYNAAKAMIRNKDMEQKRRGGYFPSSDPYAMGLAYELAETPITEHTYRYNDVFCYEPAPRNKCVDCNHLFGWGEPGEEVTCPQCGQQQVWVNRYFRSTNPRRIFDWLPTLILPEELEE